MSNYIEILGFISSAVLTATLVLKMPLAIRWVHIILSVFVAIFGFTFGYWGIGLIGSGICFASIFQLTQLLSFKDSFNILQVRGNNEYLGAFIEYYKRDIYHYSPFYKRNLESSSFLILNNLEVVGVFIVNVQDKKTLYINLDFVVPKFRNNKVGKYLFIDNVSYFSELGYERIITVCLNEVHRAYLEKMGFVEKNINDEKLYVKELK